MAAPSSELLPEEASNYAQHETDVTSSTEEDEDHADNPTSASALDISSAQRRPLEQELELNGSLPGGEQNPARSPLLVGHHPSELRRRDDGFELDDNVSNRDSEEEDDNDRPSNEKLLGTAFVSFMSFALVQLFFAFVAGSKAMMGDSAAMIVDALTYLFNWVAERQKSHFDETYVDNAIMEDPARAKRRKKRARRKMVLQAEIIPPLISVSTLIVVTAFVLRNSIKILILDFHRSAAMQKRPNVNLMMAFSLFNLLLDGLNVFCFARAKHLFGYQTEGDHVGHVQHHHVTSAEPSDTTEQLEEGRSMPKTQQRRPGSSYRQLEDTDGSVGSSNSEPCVEMATAPRHPRNGWNSSPVDDSPTTTRRRDQALDESDHSDESEDDDKEEANLNMCSAYTHVFADTLRSIAVIVASAIAELVHGVTPEEADATAAIVVSILVLLSLIPLFHGLVSSVSELRAIQSEELSESMFPEHANQTAEIT